MISVSVKNISKSYNKIKAIENLSFEVEKSELFGLIGPDGAGKTSIFRILTSLILPDSGDAIIENFDVKTDYKKIREIIGYMPGKFSLYQDLSVEENLEFFANVFGTTVKKNYDLIHDIYIQLEPFKKRLAGKLSGGMKQKLALCCALIHKPKILFLDEPTTGVDAVSRKEFWEMLQNLKQNNITILVSTPYMDEATLCDKVALIQQGKILNIDTPKNITTNFDKKVFSINSKDKLLLINDLRQFEFAKSVYAFGDSIHYIDKRADFQIFEVQNFLKSKNHEQVEIKQITADIEDCFMELMN